MGLWEDEIELAPVFGGHGTFAGPVWIVVQMVRHLCGPTATQMAIEQVTLDGLAETGRAAGNIHFPSRREIQRASHWIVDLFIFASKFFVRKLRDNE